MKRTSVLVVAITVSLAGLAACGSKDGVVDGPVLSVGEDPEANELALLKVKLVIDAATDCLVIDKAETGVSALAHGAAPLVKPGRPARSKRPS